jgi:hypothetical protein
VREKASGKRIEAFLSSERKSTGFSDAINQALAIVQNELIWDTASAEIGGTDFITQELKMAFRPINIPMIAEIKIMSASEGPQRHRKMALIPPVVRIEKGHELDVTAHMIEARVASGPGPPVFAFDDLYVEMGRKLESLNVAFRRTRRPVVDNNDTNLNGKFQSLRND